MLAGASNLYVGQYTSGVVVTITSSTNYNNTYVGYSNTDSNNELIIVNSGTVLTNKSDSLFTNEGNVYIGYGGSSNSMVVTNGAQIVSVKGWIGYSNTASNNSVLVTGSNSLWTNTGNLYVGNQGASNSLVISNGGKVFNANGYIGSESTAIGNLVTVTGSNSSWINSGDLYVGYAGQSNRLVISEGGFVSNVNGFDDGVDPTDAYNSVLVTGSGSRWVNSGKLTFGLAGHDNSLVISNGGIVTVGADSKIGDLATASNNSVLVTGTNSLWTNSGNLFIGNVGSGNSLVISNGGSVASGNGVIGYDANSSNNSVLVTGTGSTWSNSIWTIIGAEGSGNSMVISNGGSVASAIGIIGYNSNSSNNSVLVTGSTSLWTNLGLAVGYGGSGALTIANQGTVAASVIQIASQGGSSGTLNIGRFGGSDSAGTIRAPTITFGSGTGTINFNQIDAFTLSSAISGNGLVNQLGTGTTTLIGNNTYTGTSVITQGTLVAASTNALGASDVTLGGTANKATLRLATNLTITTLGPPHDDLTWGSNGVIALAQGTHTLTLASGMTNSAGSNAGVNAFQFLNSSLSNATNILINFAGQNGFTTNSFSVKGIVGYSFGLSPTNVTAFISTNANLVVSDFVTINDTLTVSSLTIDSTGVLRGSGTLVLTGGNLIVNGTIAPGNSPGTFFVSGGNLVMGASSVWDQQIYSTSVYDRVVVTGSAILNGVMNITTFGNGGLQFGDKYNFLTASGGISGAFSSIIAPEGFRGRLLLSGDNTEANILIAPASYTQLAANRNQSNVATALNSFIPATSGDQQVVSTSLDSLTASQYAQAFNAIMPTFYQQIATIAFNNANAQNMQLVQRLWGLRVAEGGGFSMSGMDNMPLLEGQGDGSTGKGVLDSKKDILRPGLDNHWGMFVDINGIFAQANSGNMLPGYNSQSGGVTTGLTYKWNDSFASGIYCGYQGTYTKSGADGSGLGTGSRLIDNAVRFGVFGTYGQKDGKGLFVNALAGGGYHNFQATRVIQYAGMNRTANSAPGAGELDTMLAAGYDIKKDKFTFGPTASLQYTYLGVNSLNETGAQSLNFNSGGWNSSSMLSSVGAHAAYSWVANKNVVVIPQVNLSWQHEFMQNPYAISGNLGGTSPTFSNTSATGIRDYLYTGVGFTVELNKKWNTSFFYNAAAGNSDLVSQNIFWSAGVKF
jgi:T5SS/PEP-CTERM-associated repeat protein